MLKKIRQLLNQSGAQQPPAFAVGTGRCGTHLLQELMGLHPGIDAHHIQNPDADSFYRYCAWNEFDVDQGGFLEARRHWIEAASKSGRVYFESNPYLSFHINTLYQAFGARFVFIVRNPEDVVRSHVVKGWYDRELVVYEKEKALGYQYGMQANHFFGRIVPRGTEYEHWHALSRIGRLSWMWNRVNLSVHHQLSEIPEENCFFVKIEDLDFSQFQALEAFIAGKSKVCEKKFSDTFHKKPGKGKKQTIQSWTDQEQAEFEQETQKGKEVFNY